MPTEMITGIHSGIEETPVRVAPSVGSEFNLVRSFLLPKACFKVEDAHFAFDSSFLAAANFDVRPLKTLLDEHPGCKLSIFGHADPTGDDADNKTLSGRRASAVYALLIRDVAVWENLYDHPAGGDDWDTEADDAMSTTTGLPATTPRAQLIKAYMDYLCTVRDESGQPAADPKGGSVCVQLTKDDFLARGKGKNGKGDLQGCGEFNPSMVFSKEERTTLDKPENQADRNDKNEINRRVLVLLFRPGSIVDPQKWPCPTVDEGVDGCRLRFFSDGENRRSNQEQHREFKDTKDTFACRFYERLTTSSPCEVAALPVPGNELVEARIIDDGGKPTGGSPVVQTILQISNRVTTADLPNDYTTASADRDNFKIEVRDSRVVGDVITAAKVEIEMLKANKASFDPKRTSNVELRRVGTSDVFRSKYLRLVVDDKDLAAVPGQTLLADWDPTDHSVEILGQIVHVKYTSASGKVVESDAEVGKDRTWIDVALHILRKTPGDDASAVMTTALATEHMHKWFRRIYAQIGMAPRLVQPARYVDAPENLISISDNVGADAAGATNGISFRLRVKTDGQPDAVYNVGPHKQKKGDAPLVAADAIVRLINDNPAIPLRARSVQNGPTLNTMRGSADVIVTDPAGGRVIVEGLLTDDAAQSVTVGRVTATDFIGWGYGNPDPKDWISGSIQQRAVLQNYDTGKDRLDIVIVDTFKNDAWRGQSLPLGTCYANGKQSIDQISNSCFVKASTMSDDSASTCAHECGHCLLDAMHVRGDRTHLMTIAGTTSHMNVDGSKRISDQEVPFDYPPIGLVQETRMRSKATSVLKSW